MRDTSAREKTIEVNMGDSLRAEKYNASINLCVCDVAETPFGENLNGKLPSSI
jgi:hypothetical protein